MKILLVFTGGTIGSSIDKGAINTSNNTPFLLLELFNQHYVDAHNLQFTTLQPYYLLSENLAPKAWTDLITALVAQNLDEYDGVIITHGTDTLSYTAALLGLYFHNVNKPMLLVSSHQPLTQPQANGLANFICAIEFIKKINQPGVYVAYQNPGQPMLIHLATRLASCLPLSSDFISVRHQAYMRYENGHFTQLTEKNRPHSRFLLKAEFAHTITLIRPYPGLDYRTINLDTVQIVLHDLYHSGTACTSSAFGKHYQLTEFVQLCQTQHIPVYLAPAYQSEACYQTTLDLQQAGAEILWGISIEAAYAKLLLAYGNFYEQHSILQFLTTDIAHEHIY
ncbi:asparaginase domain-containing protein [Methylocucumis oryzae]|uniref:Asparaginase n=1 Tax=Methylocucumis oryzae TaxID=1632867 RepID=A0A0F3IH01_9GAMM|nr:asparaginase [Methylocucumis oryzae]